MVTTCSASFPKHGYVLKQIKATTTRSFIPARRPDQASLCIDLMSIRTYARPQWLDQWTNQKLHPNLQRLPCLLQVQEGSQSR